MSQGASGWSQYAPDWYFLTPVTNDTRPTANSTKATTRRRRLAGGVETVVAGAVAVAVDIMRKGSRRLESRMRRRVEGGGTRHGNVGAVVWLDER